MWRCLVTQQISRILSKQVPSGLPMGRSTCQHWATGMGVNIMITIFDQISKEYIDSFFIN
jgi:hypothetical protein